jgi:cell fate (sporulation/competence/biofilm development) regulator YmcA (YheA/YmcA/DUF963 family)
MEYIGFIKLQAMIRGVNQRINDEKQIKEIIEEIQDCIKKDARYTIRRFMNICILRYKNSEENIHNNRNVNSIISMIPALTFT